MGEYLKRMEWAMSPAQFEREWPKPYEAKGVWYLRPGYACATTPDAAAWQHAKIRQDAMATVANIPWG